MTRLALMHNGTIMELAEPKILKGRVDGVILELTCSDMSRSRRMLSDAPGILDINIFGDVLHVRVIDEEVTGVVRDRLRAGGVEVFGLKRIDPVMEDAFLSLTQERERNGGRG